jgi:hypothetical protein
VGSGVVLAVLRNRGKVFDAHFVGAGIGRVVTAASFATCALWDVSALTMTGGASAGHPVEAYEPMREFRGKFGRGMEAVYRARWWIMYGECCVWQASRVCFSFGT